MRVARKQSEADIYHVISRGTGQQIIFEDRTDYEEFLRLLEVETREGDFELYAWCLMSNHVHMLVHATLEVMALRMRHLLSGYATYFNKKSRRVGHLFQDRFLSEPVNDDAYLLTLVRYIHQNPVKAKIADVDKYQWSSYQEYMRDEGICNTRYPLSVFGSLKEFERLNRFPVDATTACLEVSKNRPINVMPDEDAAMFARDLLGGIRLDALKTLPVKDRDSYLAKLKRAGFSIRQIARLTGIGRGPIQRAAASVPAPPSP